MRQLTLSKQAKLKSLNRRARHLMLAATVAGIGGHASLAATSTWTGPSGTTAVPTTGFWNAAGNWSPSGVPASSVTTELDFLGTSSYISTDNIAGAFNLNLLKINGTGGTVNASTGSSLAFNGSAPSIQQIGVGTFTIAAPVNLTTATTVSQVNNGEIDFTDALTGAGGLTLSNSSASPTNSIVKFTGANAFASLTVNAHVTAISALSSSSTTLGSGAVNLAGGILRLQGRQTAPGQASNQAIGVTGFSGDTIRDAAPGSSATSSTGTPLNTVDTGNLLFINGFNGSQNGLPSTGIISSPLASGAQFKLGYNGTAIDLVDKNTLYFTDTTAQSLTLTTATKASALEFLAQAEKATTFDVKITFADSSVSTYNGAVTTGNWAFTSNQSNTVYNEPDVLTLGGSIATNFNAKLYESDLTLTTADAAKTISSIQFAPQTLNGGHSAEIYAINGLVTGASSVQLSTQNYGNNVNVTANSGIDVSGSLTAVMGALNIGNAKLSITSSDTTASAYTLTFGTTTLSGNATLDVANSNSSGAGLVTLGALNDGGTARTITFNPTGAGTVNLTSAATSLGTGTVINLQNGILNSSSGTSIGSSATVNLSAPATLNIGASQQVSSLSGSAGTVNLRGNTLTIGSTDNLSSNFGGVISGAGTVVANTTGTVTLSGASTFSGTQVNSNGAQIQTSVLINNNATVVAAGASNVSNGTFVSGPVGTGTVLVNAGASLLLSNTPGLGLPNPLYGTSSGSAASTFGALNTTGVTTFSGNLTLGTGSSGDNSHNAIVAATGGGEVDFTGNILANSTNGSSVTVNRLGGSGTGVVRFTGNNTYNGGTTVNPNATLAIGPSTYSTGLGTGAVTLSGGTVALRGLVPTGVQQSIGVSGYTADTILDNAATSGSMSSLGTPTSTIDSGNLFFENGYQGVVGTNNVPTSSQGLPTSGTVTSAVNTNHVFQLGPYTDYNSLRFTSPGSQALSLNTAGKFQTLDFLATSQSTATFSITLTFDDSTTDTIGGFSTADWYNGKPSNNAVTGLDPVSQGSGVIYNGAAPGNSTIPVDNYGGALTLQEYDLNVPAADQLKNITGITVNATAVNGTSAEVYAVSGATASNTPVTSQAFANNFNVTADSGIDVSGSLNASIGTLTIGGQKLSLSSADTTASPYSLTTGTVTFVSQTPTFNVANSAGGGVGTLILGSLNDQGNAQTITKSGAGTLLLGTASTQLSNPLVINITGGTLASNDPNAISYNNSVFASISIANTATFSLGADQIIGALNDNGTAVVNGSTVTLNGHTLSIGSTNDFNSTFSGKFTDGSGSAGSSGLVKQGGGVLTLKGASTYTGPTSINFGTLSAANSTGSATGTGDVTLAPTSNATLASGPVGTITGNIIAGQLSNIQPGGNGSIGTLAIGGLTTGFNTDLNFDLGTGSGIITNGDLLTLGNGTVSLTPNTLITFNTSTTVIADYRLIGGNVSSIDLTAFVLPNAPTGKSYMLSNTVDAGYIDLVVSNAATGGANLIFNNSASTTGNGTTWENGSSDPAGQNFLNASAPSYFTSGDFVTFNDNNNGHYNVNLASNVLPGSVTVTTAQTYNFTSTGGFAIGDNPVGPATTLTLSGGGTLNISNVNTYTGTTNVSGTSTVLHLLSTSALATSGLTVGTGSTANIDGLLTGLPTVSDSGAITLGASNVSNDPTASILKREWSSLTIASGSTLTFVPATTTATRTLLTVGSLTNGGKIDLSNNDMVIHNGSGGSVTTAGSIANQIASGFNNGQFNGALGIVSSTASSNSRHLTAIGYAPGGSAFDGSVTTATDILVKYTYFGDANLDGKVDASDYSKIDSGFVTHSTGWYNGDFNYDGLVNGSDYTLIDNAFNTQGAQITAQYASPTAEPTAQIAGSVASAVPEPTTLGLIAFGAAGLLGRRSRSRTR